MGLMKTKATNYIRIFFFFFFFTLVHVLWKNNKLDKNVLYGNSKIRNKNNKNIGADKKKKVAYGILNIKITIVHMTEVIIP